MSTETKLSSRQIWLVLEAVDIRIEEVQTALRCTTMSVEDGEEMNEYLLVLEELRKTLIKMHAEAVIPAQEPEPQIRT